MGDSFHRTTTLHHVFSIRQRWGGESSYSKFKITNVTFKHFSLYQFLTGTDKPIYVTD
jgi:hypothetical protein